MKITILAFGTRGDVQPLLALGKALQARGHQVRMIASANFKGWIDSHGLEGIGSAVDIQALMMGSGGQKWVDHGNSQVRQVLVIRELLVEHAMSMMQDAWTACEGAEAIISTFTSDPYAVSIAEKLGAHLITALVQPVFIPTRSGSAGMMVPLPDRNSPINKLFGSLFVEPVPWLLLGRVCNRFRREVLGLPRQTYRGYLAALWQRLVVLGYSEHVVPHPDDWPAYVHTTSYWFLDEDPEWQPPPDLQAFLDAGEPPVYVGFGSMAGRDPEGTTRIILDALEQAGQRGLLQSGWGGIGSEQLPPSVFPLDSIPHHRLFPRMRAAVHHGGAGTTAESLRAGLPTVIVPHLADQPYWGRRVHFLGVGPKPVRRDRLTAERLAAAIGQAASEVGMRQRAADLGEKIRGEDGIAEAVRLIDRFISHEGKVGKKGKSAV